MSELPKVTVLMPVYNGERYLKEAIESILDQTFTDFEFLIINDGSTDRSVGIIESYADSRIRLVDNGENLGLIKTLNKGIDLTRGEYIARMDADDISLPKRLEKQVGFMDSHPKVGICGTWARIIDERGLIKGLRKVPAGRTALTLCWRPSPFIHSSCIMRSTLLQKNKYSLEYPHAEDYALWLTLSRTTGFHNLDEYLLLYRIHGTNIGRKERSLQLQNSYKAFVEFIGSNKISYEGFLALIPVEAKVHPLKRAYYYWLASSCNGFNSLRFIIDNLIYIKLWLMEYHELR
jgi:glycosyltransferase involved in cell wall biosynthesis